MLIPSIDLMNGKAVQLQQGEGDKKIYEREDVFELLEEFSMYGEVAIIDLDAAMGKGSNQALIEQLLRRRPCRVGGGIRDMAAADAWLEAGVDRVVIGTAAVNDPDMVKEVCRKHSARRVVVSVDAKDGLVAVKGWKETSSVTVLELAHQMAGLGVERLLYTDIARDGALTGPNLTTNARLAKETGLAVLASGGVATVEHIKELVPTGVEGVIVGRALYTGAVSLPEALAAVG